MGSKKGKEKKVGYRFRPEEGFLVAVLDRLVRMKAKGLEIDLDDHTEYPGDLSEMFLYGPGKEPWKVFSGEHEIVELHQTSDPERKIREKYVVAKLNRVGDKNFSRTAGAGCWLDKSKKSPVYVGGREVGHWRTLTYEYSGGDGAADGKWYYFMNELHLDKRSDYVICRVMKNLSKGCRVKVGTKRPRQDDDCRPAAKRSRREEKMPEEIPEESDSCCSEVVHLLDETLEEEDQECTSSQQIDFSGPACDPDILSFIGECSDMFGAAQEQEQVAYVPDMSGLVQNDEQQVSSEFFDIPQDWVPSSSTLGACDDQFSFVELMNEEHQVSSDFFDFPQLQQPSSSTFGACDDQWTFEEIMNSVQQTCC